MIPASEAAKDLGASASVLKYFQANKILEIRQDEILRKPVDIRKIPLTGKAQLTDAQKQAVCKIRREWESDNSRTVLAPRNNRQWKNACIYRTDPTDDRGGKTGDCTDPGDCTYLSDSTQILLHIWR